MNTVLKLAVLSSALAALAGPLAVLAQQPPGTPAAPGADTQLQHSTPQSEAGEPRAATSDAPTAPSSATPSAAVTPAGSPPPSPAPASRAQRGPAAPPGGSKSTAQDRLELGTATVTGDREQPKVMYIVPWKKSDIGDLSGKPMNSLLDEALAPVDRDEFKRQVVYYQAVKADASQNGASKAPAQQGEK
jgi:hypothetical protein